MSNPNLPEMIQAMLSVIPPDALALRNALVRHQRNAGYSSLESDADRRSSLSETLHSMIHAPHEPWEDKVWDIFDGK